MANAKKKRQTKSVHLAFRITAGMSKKLEAFWGEYAKDHPDISFSSAVREAIRRGMEA
tara:strand:- start:444 stop:617 length:174 start_codon:yes stop_codon:yes gene_type:complete